MSKKKAARQRRAAANQRKAKGRNEHELKYRTGLDRPRLSGRHVVHPAQAALQIGRAMTLSPDLMDRLFGDRS